MHVVPMELPNRRFPVPPPFMFHPELQPEFAERNIKDFKPLSIPTKKSKRVRKPQQLGAIAVASGDEKRFSMPAEVGPRTLMRAPALYEFTAEGYDERLEPLRDELHGYVQKHLLSEKTERFIGEANE